MYDNALTEKRPNFFFFFFYSVDLNHVYAYNFVLESCPRIYGTAVC